MTRALLLVLFLLSAPIVARAQGAIIETLDDLKNVPEPPGLRGDLPMRVDLTGKIPPPRTQVDTSTCVSWAAIYAAGSYALRRAGHGDTLTLSPAFSYNQVSRDRFCLTNTAISNTLDLLRDVGAQPIEEFTFDAGWCGRLPTDAERQRAARYRIKGWSHFDATNIDAVKTQLARGAPVIFSMLIGSKLKAHRSQDVFSTDEEAVVGHAMVVVGYDEARKAFAIQNSWGRSWGDGGYAWFAYEFWRRNVKVGFVID
jgi:C1A family cysteine protease